MFHTSHVFSLCLWLVGVFGVTVEVKSVMEGQNVTLHTNLSHIQTDHVIKWRFGNILIATINRSRNINPTYNNNNTEMFRDRLEMNNQTGDLTITHITSQHSGLYKLRINISDEPKVKKNITVTVNARTAVSISESTQTPSSSESSVGQSGSIIPLSCAAAVGFLVVVTALLIICKKQTNKQQRDETCEEEITYADTSFYRHDTQTKSVKEENEVVYSGVVTRR